MWPEPVPPLCSGVNPLPAHRRWRSTATNPAHGASPCTHKTPEAESRSKPRRPAPRKKVDGPRARHANAYRMSAERPLSPSVSPA